MTTSTVTNPSAIAAGVTSGVSSSSTAATTSTAQGELNSNYTTFLNLLTTQLQNQDPLDPTDSSQFTNQLVLFSQVEQQINTNSTLSSILSNQTTGMTQQALNYIGLDVTATGSTFQYSGSGDVSLGYTLPTAASIATVGIFNSSGQEVWQGTGQTAAGTYPVTWDGTDSSGDAVAAGTYTVQVTAVDSAGDPITAPTSVPGTVTGVTSSNGTAYVTVAGQQIPVSDIISATTPSLASSSSTSSNTTTN